MALSTDLVAGFLLNLAAAVLVVRFIYYPVDRNKAYVFTFLAFNTIIFFVLSFMHSVEMSIGVGFGLFAIFSVLRYRTDPIPIREMTYLFIIAALPVMNSAALNSGIPPDLLFANGAVVLILYALEKGWGFRFESSRTIIYEKIELIRPENRHLMLADLEARTGLTIKRCSVGRISFLRDTAEITITYEADGEAGWRQATGRGHQAQSDQESLVVFPLAD